jgi:hypothetical protein
LKRSPMSVQLFNSLYAPARVTCQFLFGSNEKRISTQGEHGSFPRTLVFFLVSLAAKEIVGVAAAMISANPKAIFLTHIIPSKPN